MARPKTRSANDVLLKAWVPPTDATALDSLVAVTGEAKASHIRRAVASYLATFDLATPMTTSVVNYPKKETTK